MKVTDDMVNRFLSWKLPEDFHPDAGISFNPEFNVEWNAKHGKPPQRHEPIGTNLLTATQAKAMLEHVLAPVSESVQTIAPHTAASEKDTMLLRAFTPAKTMAPGFQIEYWNLTMVRMKGDVVLTVRLPSEFSHYVQTDGGRMAAWHPGAVSSVRFTRESLRRWAAR